MAAAAAQSASSPRWDITRRRWRQRRVRQRAGIAAGKCVDSGEDLGRTVGNAAPCWSPVFRHRSILPADGRRSERLLQLHRPPGDQESPRHAGPGHLGHRQGRRRHRRRRPGRDDAASACIRDITDQGPRQPARPRHHRSASRRIAGRAGRQHLRPHLPHAPGRQDRDPQQGADPHARRPLAWRTRPGWRGSASPSRTTRSGPSPSPSSRTRWRSSPTAPPCSGWATSGRRRPCRSWRARPCSSRSWPGVDAFPICLDTKDPDKIVETVKLHRARLRRHQPRGHLGPALLRDRGAAAEGARHPGLPRRPARHRGGGAGRAAERAARS